jgi:hypothetical protein
MLSQQAGTKTVKGARPHRFAWCQLSQPQFHFFGRFVGKRQCQDLPGGDPLTQQKRDPMRDNASFPAAWARQNQ